MSQIDPIDFRDALRSVKTVKSLLVLFLALALIAQVAVFVLVDIAGILKEDTSGNVTTALMWVLAASKFVGLALAALLVVTLVFAALLSLVGQLGSPSGFIGAFYWALILLAILVPWQTVLAPTFACGATFSLGDMVEKYVAVKAGGVDLSEDFLDVSLYYARFIAYPVFALFVLLVTGMKFGSGYRPLKIRSSAAPAAVVAPTPEPEI